MVVAEAEDEDAAGDSPEVTGLAFAGDSVVVGWDVGGEGDAAAVRFWGNCGSRAGSGGMVGLIEGGEEELRLLPKDDVDGDIFLAGLSGGVYCVPTSTVVFEERADVDKEVREAAIVGLDRPGNAAAGGRRM